MTTISFKKFNIEAYKPGKSSFKKLKKVIKLSANESALGMSPRVKRIVFNKKLNFSRYPDGKSEILRSQISKKFKCNKEKIICGAGSDEVIQMLCQLFLKPRDEVVVPQFSFLMYRIYSKIVGAKVIFAKEKKFKISVKEIIKKVTKKTKIVFIANPNNPTGTYLTKNELIDLRRKLRNNILLVVDDAYAEYMKNKDYESGLDLFKNKENVFILRTFSKIYGLSSLRVGWGYGSRRIIDALNIIKPPFNVNGIAQKAAVEVLMEEPEHHAKLWENTNYFRKELQSLGFDTGASVTPIIPVMCGDSSVAKAMTRALGEEGVMAGAIVFPMVARDKARIRTQMSAGLSRDDLDEVLRLFEKVGPTLDLI